ncbi:MAG: hypothetical protein LBB61_02030, partial [Treponema sp.]|nr:hypothetical protein [Treponema sp.]
HAVHYGDGFETRFCPVHVKYSITERKSCQALIVGFFHYFFPVFSGALRAAGMAPRGNAAQTARLAAPAPDYG